MLRSYLSAEFAAQNLDAFHALHVRAARYFEVDGSPALALEHAALGRNSDLVAELLQRHGLQLLRGERGCIARAVERLPPDHRDSPPVQLLAAYLALQDWRCRSCEQRSSPSKATSTRGDLHTAGLFAALVLYEGRLSGSRGSTIPELLNQPQLDDTSVESLFLSAQRG